VKEGQAQDIVREFEGVSFGDKRLDHRLSVVAKAMALAPTDSIVEQAGSVSALEATYRFLANERVHPELVFGCHATRTAERATAHDSVLVVHDTTEFRFGGSVERKGLGRVNTDKRDGFLAHYSICLAPDGEPLGSLELLAWSRLDRDKRPMPRGSLRDPNRESLRWAESALLASERLSGRTQPIHVMDREGDQFELFATLLENDERFVIRVGHDRRLKKGRGRKDCPMLNEVLGGGPALFTRQARLGRRERDVSTKKRKVHPKREARNAYLEVRARSIDLHRGHQHVEHLPDYLPLNFVEAREVDAPLGSTPVVWRLVTTEPIDTHAQIAKVIDIYRKRWTIEEFFKAIKTGCRFESHQLENIKGLLVALSVESTIAWQLLRLRHLSRSKPNASGNGLLSSAQLETVIRLRASRGVSCRRLRVRDVIDEVARLGVHLKHNGPPGWLVLKRGLHKLSLLTDGFRLSELPIPNEI